MTAYYFIHIINRIESDYIDQKYYLVPVEILKQYEILDKIDQSSSLTELLQEYFFDDSNNLTTNNPILEEYQINKNNDYNDNVSFKINNGKIIKYMYFMPPAEDDTEKTLNQLLHDNNNTIIINELLRRKHKWYNE